MGEPDDDQLRQAGLRQADGLAERRLGRRVEYALHCPAVFGDEFAYLRCVKVALASGNHS